MTPRFRVRLRVGSDEYVMEVATREGRQGAVMAARKVVDLWPEASGSDVELIDVLPVEPHASAWDALKSERAA